MKRTLRLNQPMSLIRAALCAGVLALTASCQDFLDVNNNPNGPETATPNLYLPQMLHAMVADPQWDGRYIGDYTQMWYRPTAGAFNTWDRMGYDRGNDNGGQTWRDVYWTLGQNLKDMIRKSEEEERWDIMGVGMMLKGWGWMSLAGLHGDLIVRQAFDSTRFSFDYDTEAYALLEARKFLDSAIVLLRRTDGKVSASYLGRTDKIYNGDRDKWRKYTFGLRALLRNRYSNKASLYRADSVLLDVDSSFVSNVDDALLQWPATHPTDDRNFYGTTRANHGSFRQTRFILQLMDGTQFGGAVDPRMTRMLAPSPDGVYRGLDVNTQFYGSLTVPQRPNNFMGYASNTGPAPGSPSRYFFSDKSRWPAMTYSQLQFVKAEAAYRLGDRPAALTAYTNGVSSHIDFVNARNLEEGATPAQITAAEKSAFLANANIIPTAANLTMRHIMSQKFIAQWAWGFFEAWMDMRRFFYTGTYGSEAGQVFPGFAIPTNLDADNGGQPAYRLRPRYNSEYVWNQKGLAAITPIPGTAGNYHTSQLWIIQP